MNPRIELSPNTARWICYKCAFDWGGELPAGKTPTYHHGLCGVCCTNQTVTEPRDYRWAAP